MTITASEIIDQIDTAEEEQAAEDALLESTGRESAHTWQAYEEARGRLMQVLLFEYGSVASLNGVALAGLTANERAEIVEQRKRAAQSAWIDYFHAETAYIAAVDGNMPVEYRQP